MHEAVPHANRLLQIGYPNKRLLCVVLQRQSCLPVSLCPRVADRASSPMEVVKHTFLEIELDDSEGQAYSTGRRGRSFTDPPVSAGSRALRVEAEPRVL
eukprot:2005383-Amphidinium_carterae.1